MGCLHYPNFSPYLICSRMANAKPAPALGRVSSRAPILHGTLGRCRLRARTLEGRRPRDFRFGLVVGITSNKGERLFACHLILRATSPPGRSAPQPKAGIPHALFPACRLNELVYVTMNGRRRFARATKMLIDMGKDIEKQAGVGSKKSTRRA